MNEATPRDCGARETSARGLLLTLVALLVLAAFSLVMRFAHLGAAGWAGRASASPS